MSITLLIQNPNKITGVPTKKQFIKWIETALASTSADYELVIRIVDHKEITKLNHKYRNKNTPTNIISFNFTPPLTLPSNFLGDLVICAAIVNHEAQIQNKSPSAHWAHLTIHGVLHLLGYDHQTAKEAKQMESREIALLKTLGVPNPYH